MLNERLNFVDKLKTNPKRIFLIDALGALLTSILLFGVLAQLEQYFGMPSNALYVLSVIAFCLFVYSIICHQLIKSNWKPFLRMVMIFNSIYLLFSIGLIFSCFEKISGLGFIYFIVEFIVIGIIIIIEFESYSIQQ